MNVNSSTKKLTSQNKQKSTVRLHANEAINSLLTVTAANWRLPLKHKITLKNNKKIEK